ncbi:phosphatase PAP2 family protein [Cupriavidus sp. Marseille-Q8015]
MTLWHLVTRLGESTLLMPCAAVVCASLWLGPARRDRRNAARWMVTFGVAVAIVVASKLAFMGWGIGSHALDFTGVSGHAMMSAALWPVLARLLVPDTPAPAAPSSQLAGRPPRSTRASMLALVAGMTLATMVAVSRLVLGLHSPAEAAAGLAVGFAASGAFLAWADKPLRAAPLMAALTVVLLAAAVPVRALSLPTHHWLEAVAVQLSGRDRPYRRDNWRGALPPPALLCAPPNRIRIRPA